MSNSKMTAQGPPPHKKKGGHPQVYRVPSSSMLKSHPSPPLPPPFTNHRQHAHCQATMSCIFLASRFA